MVCCAIFFSLPATRADFMWITLYQRKNGPLLTELPEKRESLSYKQAPPTGAMTVQIAGQLICNPL
jgi:hypothetical protein